MMFFISEALVREQAAELIRRARRERLAAEARATADRPRRGPSTLLRSLLGRLEPRGGVASCEPEAGR